MHVKERNLLLNLGRKSPVLGLNLKNDYYYEEIEAQSCENDSRYFAVRNCHYHSRFDETEKGHYDGRLCDYSSQSPKTQCYTNSTEENLYVQKITY
jgi:hypothetical protein